MSTSNSPGTCPECKKRHIHARGKCRSCYDRWLKSENPEYLRRQRLNTSEWHEANKDYIREYGQNRRRNPEVRRRHRELARRKRLCKLGLPGDSSQRLLELQNGSCGCCGRDLDKVGAVHLDHDHSTGVASGYLCSRCNNGLGMLGDDIEGIERALSYLRNSPYSQLIFDQTRPSSEGSGQT